MRILIISLLNKCYSVQDYIPFHMQNLNEMSWGVKGFTQAMQNQFSQEEAVLFRSTKEDILHFELDCVAKTNALA